MASNHIIQFLSDTWKLQVFPSMESKKQNANKGHSWNQNEKNQVLKPKASKVFFEAVFFGISSKNMTFPYFLEE